MIDKILTLFFILLFLIAGILHLTHPQLFLKAMPNYIPFHKEIVFLTGILEVIIALGLLVKKFRKGILLIICIYLLAILPAHIHVSIHGIEMFGVSNKIFLWLRTLGQFVFIYFAYNLSKRQR